jgi:hypothetical protein
LLYKSAQNIEHYIQKKNELFLNRVTKGFMNKRITKKEKDISNAMDKLISYGNDTLETD